MIVHVVFANANKMVAITTSILANVMSVSSVSTSNGFILTMVYKFVHTCNGLLYLFLNSLLQYVVVNCPS